MVLSERSCSSFFLFYFSHSTPSWTVLNTTFVFLFLYLEFIKVLYICELWYCDNITGIICNDYVSCRALDSVLNKTNVQDEYSVPRSQDTDLLIILLHPCVPSLDMLHVPVSWWLAVNTIKTFGFHFLIK